MNDLYIEDIGDKSAPPLLYLHGGPGTGSYDFVMFQRELLADKARLIAVDQRGVLRSPRIADSDECYTGFAGKLPSTMLDRQRGIL